MVLNCLLIAAFLISFSKTATQSVAYLPLVKPRSRRVFHDDPSSVTSLLLHVYVSVVFSCDDFRCYVSYKKI